MAPELFATMEANELQELAHKIRDWQTAKNLSDNALLRKLPQLGSTKTFSRILKSDLAELDLDRQLASYRAAWAFVESLADAIEHAEEERYDDLWPAVTLRRAVLEAMRETGLARVVFLLGPSGSGKSTARQLLVERYGSRLLQAEATVAWNDSPMAMLGAILEAMGKREKPSLQVDRLAKVVEMLGESRRCLIIEEGHHLGPRCLNLVKTLVNQTPGEFVIVAIDTLWRKLETAAYEEARQLTGNRLAERITLGRDLRENDVRKILERRLKWISPEVMRAAARIIMDKAVNYGRYAFVRDVVKRAAQKADGGDNVVSAEIWAAAVAEEAASR